MNPKDASNQSVWDQAMSQVVEKARQLYEGILQASIKDEHVWFRNLLCGILRCALMDYYSVQIGAKKSIYLAAWGSRNLLELRVISDYILASRKNALDFKNDLAIDAKEFYEALSKKHKAMNEKLLSDLSQMAAQEKGPMKGVLEQALRRESESGPQTEDTDSEAEAHRQVLAEYGLKASAKPKRASEIASLINQKADFVISVL